jgi:hypothetical protein
LNEDRNLNMPIFRLTSLGGASFRESGNVSGHDDRFREELPDRPATLREALHKNPRKTAALVTGLLVGGGGIGAAIAAYPNYQAGVKSVVCPTKTVTKTIAGTLPATLIVSSNAPASEASGFNSQLSQIDGEMSSLAAVNSEEAAAGSGFWSSLNTPATNTLIQTTTSPPLTTSTSLSRQV